MVNKDKLFLTCLNVAALDLLWRLDSPANTWAELNPSCSTETVNLYGPGTGSGTYDYFNEKVQGRDAAGTVIEGRTDSTPSEDDNVLVEGVTGDMNALSYV